jgi:hypothetical protein
MQIKQPDFPLTLLAFASALRTGHGQVMQQIKGHGSVGLEGAIIENCVACTSYDPQCEAERAPWLFSIVDGANLKTEVTQAIAALLRDPPPEDHRDLAQRSSMLRELAVAGVDDARRLLYLSLARLSGTASVIGDGDIVALDGVAGLIHVARQLGQWVQDDPDFWVDDYLISEFDAAPGCQDGLALLEREAATDPDIARYLAGIHRTREAVNNNAKRADELAMTGAQIVAHVKTKPKNQCHWFRRWGTQADPEQREVVYSALLETNEPEQVTRFFRCFSKSGVPRFDTRLLPWIFHTDRTVQWAAVRAVASFGHPELRSAALQLIANGDLAHGARLLVGNFEEGDLSRCAQRFERPTDIDQCHSLCGELLELCAAHPCPEALDCLLCVYEFSPCSTCRYDAVKALIGIGIAPAWLLEEAAFDADPDTRALVLGDMLVTQET